MDIWHGLLIGIVFVLLLMLWGSRDEVKSLKETAESWEIAADTWEKSAMKWEQNFHEAEVMLRKIQ